MESSSPRVSILVPLHNKERYVGETIRSALAQTVRNLEVIVIDDGSTDGSLEAVRSIDDARLQVIHRRNRGANVTRNELLEAALGEFVQFLDADDIILPEKIERQLALMEAGADAAFCRVGKLSSDGVLQPGVSSPDVDRLFRTLARRGVVTVAPLYRREHVLAAGGWREGLPASQEYELHLRLALRGYWSQVGMVDEVLALHRKAPESTSSDELRVYRAKVAAIKGLLDLSGSEHLSDLSWALASASRHLNRSHCMIEAQEALRIAIALDSKGPREAFPRRMRRVPDGLLLLVDSIDSRTKRLLRVKEE